MQLLFFLSSFAISSSRSDLTTSSSSISETLIILPRLLLILPLRFLLLLLASFSGSSICRENYKLCKYKIRFFLFNASFGYLNSNIPGWRNDLGWFVGITDAFLSTFKGPHLAEKSLLSSSESKWSKLSKENINAYKCANDYFDSRIAFSLRFIRYKLPLLFLSRGACSRYFLLSNLFLLLSPSLFHSLGLWVLNGSFAVFSGSSYQSFDDVFNFGAILELYSRLWIDVNVPKKRRN